MNKKYIYLASPYSSPDKAVQQARYEQALAIAATLLRNGHYIYSPIVHCHEMQRRFGLPWNWEFWKEYDEIMIRGADALWVLAMDGWKESVGVAAEIKIAESLGIPVEMVEVAV